MEIKENIEQVKKDIEKYSKNPKKVTLLVVTKYVGNEEVKEVLESGNNNLGENRVQVLEEKIEKFGTENVNWHFIGNLQRNKVKYIADYITMIHSVSSFRLAEEINKQAIKKGRIIDILLEVNISGEESKSGFSIDELKEKIKKIEKMPNINIKGLMTMAPYLNEEEKIRKVFIGLRELRDELNDGYLENKILELSMGMSNDYKIALEEGATIIRLGSQIFKK